MRFLYCDVGKKKTLCKDVNAKTEVYEHAKERAVNSSLQKKYASCNLKRVLDIFQVEKWVKDIPRCQHEQRYGNCGGDRALMNQSEVVCV